MKLLKKMLACLLCVAMLFTGNVFTMSFAEETENTVGIALRAMSFNIRYLLDDPYDAITYTKEQRSKVVLDQIQYYSPDVLGVQEDTNEWKDVLTEGLSGYSVYTGAAIAGSGYDASYNEIFYKTERFTLIESGCKWLTDTPDEKSSVADNIHIRRVNYVVLQDKTTGTQFCFANTHLHNGMEAPAQSYRAQQAKHLMDILDDVTAKYQNLPVVLVGDFNGGTKTDTLIDVITQSGLSDARNIADAVESDVNATWNTGYDNPANYGKASRIMDHCFVSSRVSVHKFRVATEKYPDVNGNMLCTSDHFPLVVDTTVTPLIVPDCSWYQESADTYRLYDAADLLGFAELLKNGTTFDGKTVYLCNDIALNGEPAYVAASAAHKSTPFSGTFDGQSYVISGLSTTELGSYATGLIPYVTNTATIRNVTVMNSSFTGTSNVSAVVGVYSASEKDAAFVMKNVHVENTVLKGTTGSAGIVGMMGNFTASGVSVHMEDITFTGGSVTAEYRCGGMIGEILNEEGNDYANGVALTMNRIVSASALKFTGYEYDPYDGKNKGADCVKAGSLIGNVEGFRTVNITNVFVGGSLSVTSKNKGSSPFAGYIKSINTQGEINDTTVNSTFKIQYALAALSMENVAAYLFTESDAQSYSAYVTMQNIWNDISKGTAAGRKVMNGAGDVYPSTAADHQTTTQNLIGKQLFDGWMITGDTSYPVPTARPVRLIGYQSSYATDVTDAKDANETYSIRLIAALNDDFYTYAGFENITVSYTDAKGNPVVVPKADYRCKYAYNNVRGVDRHGSVQTYAASDYDAEHLIALEIKGIPESVTEFTITLNAFAGKDGVSFAGITRAVSIVAA